MWKYKILITTWKLITLDKLLSWAGVLGAQQTYIHPHFTGNDKGLYATMKRWAYRPLIIW